MHRDKRILARDHAKALLALASDDGLHGPVPVGQLATYYREVCWEHGYEPLPMKNVLYALGRLLKKRKVRQGSPVITQYWLPKDHGKTDT